MTENLMFKVCNWKLWLSFTLKWINEKSFTGQIIFTHQSSYVHVRSIFYFLTKEPSINSMYNVIMIIFSWLYMYLTKVILNAQYQRERERDSIPSYIRLCTLFLKEKMSSYCLYTKEELLSCEKSNFYIQT